MWHEQEISAGGLGLVGYFQSVIEIECSLVLFKGHTLETENAPSLVGVCRVRCLAVSGK